MSGESERLVARIKTIRQSLPTPDVVTRLRQTSTGDPAPADDPAPATLLDLRTRVAHLEQLVQGLQDSVYRETQRQDTRMADLEARLDPGALAAALSQETHDRRPMRL